MARALGAYIFAGGFSEGMRTQFDLVGHLEDGMFGVETTRRNFPGLPVATSPKTWQPEKHVGIDVLYGNPACASWSVCGRSIFNGADNWKTDKNTQQALNLRALLPIVQPSFWVMESVCLTLQRGAEFVSDLADEAAALGYQLSLFQLDAKLWGLPQQRRRVFIIAHKYAIQWRRPPVIRRNVQDALDSVVDPGEVYPMPPHYAELLPYSPQGTWLKGVWEKRNGYRPREKPAGGGRMPGRPTFSVHRVTANKPCDSILGDYATYIHPHEDRFLGTKELAALCGFSSSYIWPTIKKAGPEIGKGVTVTAATVLAEHLAAALQVGEPAVTGRVTTIDTRPRSIRLDDYSCAPTLSHDDSRCRYNRIYSYAG